MNLLLVTLFMMNSFLVISLQTPFKYITYNNIRPLYYELYYLEEDYNNKKIFDNKYSLEHVIPRSVYKDNNLIKRDMHNIILYPNKINNHRSNYKYISDFKLHGNSILLDKFGNKIKYNKPLSEEDIYIKTNGRKTFMPAKKYRGYIARSAMYFLSTYPKYQDVILKDIIDPYTLLTWHFEYPVNNLEKEKNYMINSIQGNNNIYVSEPSLLVYDMEDILGNILPLFYDYYNQQDFSNFK